MDGEGILGGLGLSCHIWAGVVVVGDVGVVRMCEWNGKLIFITVYHTPTPISSYFVGQFFVYFKPSFHFI